MTTWQFTPVAACYALAAGISFVLSYLGLKLRPARGAGLFSLLTLFAGIWPLGYLLGFFNTDLVWKLFMLRLEYIGIIGSTFVWVLFVAVYVQYEHWLTKRTLLILGVIPFLTFFEVLFVEFHPFFYQAYTLTGTKGLVLFQKDYGPGFYIWAGFAYMMFPAGGLILIRGMLRMPPQLRRQTLPVFWVVVLSVVCNFLYIGGFNPFAPYDPTPLSFVANGLVFMIIMRRYRFLDIVPTAHDKVFQSIKAGVVVLDERARIQEMNPMAEQVLGQRQKDVLGRPAVDVFPQYENLVEHLSLGQEIKMEIRLGKQQRMFEFRSTPLKLKRSKSAGHIIMLYDIGRRKRMEDEQVRLIRELKQKNGQLSDALEEIKTLKGILPICSVCKKIRDDKGYWNLLEAYIETHSQASFTHGICPDCTDKMYGGEDWYVKMKQRKEKGAGNPQSGDPGQSSGSVSP